jgi:uncharacterized protein (DUF983 family)
MKIRNSSGPQRCKLCLRDKDDAIKEHLQTNKPCCPQCPLGDIIKEALNKTTFDSVNHNNEDSEKNISKDIVDFIVWVIVGIFVYYLTYIVWEWNQILAIITAIFWPISAVVAFYYYLIKLISGIF